MKLLHELESDEYWKQFDWVMNSPDGRVSTYVNPMFEVREEDYDEACEDEIERLGDCLCVGL